MRPDEAQTTDDAAATAAERSASARSLWSPTSMTETTPMQKAVHEPVIFLTVPSMIGLARTCISRGVAIQSSDLVELLIDQRRVRSTSRPRNAAHTNGACAREERGGSARGGRARLGGAACSRRRRLGAG